MPAIELIRRQFATLSARQREIALLLADGLTNGQIAQQIGVTVHTVKAHRAEVMRRMQAASFAELAAQLQRLQSDAASPVAGDGGPLRIIVVEDDPWYRDYLADNLITRNFSVRAVADGQALKLAWAEQPADIVILDIELGAEKEDGLMLASRFLASSRCGVIMVTARGKPDDRIKGLSVGADAYFSKPVNINELAVCLSNLGRRVRA